MYAASVMRVTIVLALLLALPSSASAQAPTPGHGMTPLQESLRRGDMAFVAHDLDGAAAAYREAAQRDPHSAVAQLRLAAVARARDDAASALGNVREALRISTEAQADADRARAMCAIAEIDEAQGHWSEALTAWGAVRDFGAAHPGAASATVASSRIDAIRRRDQLEHDYAPVRERIAERLRINAAGAPTPPGTVPVAPSH